MPRENPYHIFEQQEIQLHQFATKDNALFKGNKQAGLEQLNILAKNIAGLQNKLFANGKKRILIVLQGMDAAGKSSTIREVFRFCNSLGVHAHSFGKPSEEELKRDYLWRIHAHVPRRGEIAIFDRSHYEDITTVRVLGLLGDKQLKKRIAHLCNFEQQLIDEDTIIVKFFLHLSKKKQAEQLKQRLMDETKSYKFNPADLQARQQWSHYQRVWADAISATATQHAPWYIIPADRRWYRKLAIAQIIHDTLNNLNLHWPTGNIAQEERDRWLKELSQ